MKRFLFQIIALVTLVVVVACGHSNNDDQPAQVANHSFAGRKDLIKGDPMSVIKGMLTNPKSFINAENIANIDGYRGKYHTFVQYDKSAETKPPSPPSGLKVYDKKLGPPHYNLSFAPSSSTAKVYTYAGEDGRIFTMTESTKFPGTFEFSKIASGNEEYKISVIHYSEKNDHTAFSILFYLQEPDQNTLAEVVFTKDFAKSYPPEASDSAYGFKYLFGDGVKIHLNQHKPFVMNFCGAFTKRYRNLFSLAVEEWKQILKGKLEISYNFVDTCPPFSDLNFHGVYFVEDLLESIDEENVCFGSTLDQPNFTVPQLIDADVFIYKKEIEKPLRRQGRTLEDVDLSLAGDLIPWAFKHEFGHVLGLNHITDGTPSIMDASQSGHEITQYDRDAVNELYPYLENALKPKTGWRRFLPF